MPLPSQRKYDTVNLHNLEVYSKKVRKAYLQIINEIAKLGVNLKTNNNGEFYFRNNPTVSKKVDKLLRQLYNEVYGLTTTGMTEAWDLGTTKHNELALYAFPNITTQLTADVRNAYLALNKGARRNFILRKDNGLSLSQKVWKNTRQLKQELELALEYGIGRGLSADSLARQIKQYLNEPEKLFRRIRDKETGILRLSKAAKAYTPGRGVYRSSYKNALRLTRNEINFSYEGSQKLKREQQPFVVGIKIQVSPSHNPSDDKGGVPCLALQGLYPKNFDFTYKWHVNCKCISTNVLKTREELDKDTDLILAGKQPTTPSTNEVKNTPENYKKVTKDLNKKWAKRKSKPRTFKNN